MSRVEKYSRQKAKIQQETDLQVNHETSLKEELPPRTKKHESTRYKLSRFYYNLIFVFFLALVIILFIYGYKHTSGT